MNLCISGLKLNNLSLNKNQNRFYSFRGNDYTDVFIKNNNDETKELKQYLIKSRNLTESEKWNLIGFVKEDDCKANEEIRYFLKQGKYYDGLFTHELDKIFAKNKTDISFTVYRGTNLEDFGFSVTNKDTIDNFYEKGKVIVAPTYLSTTLDKEHAKKFPQMNKTKLLFKINIKPEMNAIYIDKLLTEQEKYMRNFRFDEENEVFIDKLAMFQMKDKYKEGDYTIIEMDALGHEDRAKFMEDNNLKEV